MKPPRISDSNKHSQPLSRREFLRLGGLTAAGLLLGACRPSRSLSVTSSEGPVQLVYQDWQTEWFPAMVQEMLDRFHKEHPEIRVYYVPDPTDVEESLLTELQNGTGPDVFAACCSFFPILAQEEQTIDLRPFIEELSEEDIQDWDPAQYNSFFTLDGRQYGLPKYHGALALYYNKDIFDRYNVDYPDESWDHNDYLDAMLRLTHDRDSDGIPDVWGSYLDISWDRIQIHVNAWGGHFVDPGNPSRSMIGEPEALAAMEWLRARMWDDHVIAAPADVKNRTTSQAFVDGQVAMVEDGSWALKSILSEADFRVGIAPIPKGPARRATLSTTDGFGIYNGTRHPQQAWTLMKFLISKDYGRAMAKANFLQPARESLIDEWIGYVEEEFPEKAKDADLYYFADGHRKGYSVTAEIFANMTEAKQIIYQAWERIYLLGQAPVEIMKEASKEIQRTQWKVG